MGIVGVEAMSQGVPVVASDVGGVREWLRDRENGVLVSPKDPDAIAEAVRWFLDSPETILAAGRAGIHLVKDKFKPARHVKKLVDIYEAAAA